MSEETSTQAVLQEIESILPPSPSAKHTEEEKIGSPLIKNDQAQEESFGSLGEIKLEESLQAKLESPSGASKQVFETNEDSPIKLAATEQSLPSPVRPTSKHKE